MRRYISALALSAALMMPLVVRADDEHHDRDRERRVYDRDHRDYHVWNDNEERTYRHYLEEQHRDYRDWNRLNRHEQQNYWQWRHEHPDDDRR